MTKKKAATKTAAKKTARVPAARVKWTMTPNGEKRAAALLAKKRTPKKALTAQEIRIEFDLDNEGLIKFLTEHPDIKKSGILPNGNRSLTAQEVKALVTSDMPLSDIRAKVLEGVPPEKGETIFNIPTMQVNNPGGINPLPEGYSFVPFNGIPGGGYYKRRESGDTGDVQIKGSPKAVADLVKQLGAKQ